MARLQKEFGGIRDAVVLVFVPPAIQGLGFVGGFQMQVQVTALTRAMHAPTRQPDAADRP